MKQYGLSKIVSVALIGSALWLGLAACGNSGSDGGSASASASPSTTPAASPAASASASTAGEAAVVKVEAANFSWTLSQTDFKAGQPITFQIEGKGGSHGFSIVGSDVSQPIGSGETKEVTWTPDKAGQYTIKCNEYCGSGHGGMETVITVT